jgi:stage V sporulation protein G
MVNRVPIYKSGTYNYAREHGETQQLRASLDANHAVQDYLRNDISKYYVGGERFYATALMQDLKKEFGLDRAMHVLLASVHDWDGRFSTATVERAKTEFYISTSTDNNLGDFEKDFCYTDMHPVYLDEVIKKGLQMEREFAQIRENTANVKSFEDFKIGETYLNHNGLCYTVLDKGKTYFDEPFIKVQSVTDIPEYAWTCWAVHPQIGEDGTLEWAYSKERDMTIDPEKNINNENLEEQEMNDTMKITANMTALMQGTEKDPSFRGFASITINDSYAIKDITVRENCNSDYPTAFYAELPSIKIGDKYEPVVYATAQAREALNIAITGAMKSAVVYGKNMDNHYPTFSADCAVDANTKPITVSIRDNPYDNSSVKAYAKVTIASHFEINRVKVCDGKNGNFVSMPSKKGSDGEYYDTVKPITVEARENLVNAVMARFEEQEKVIGNTPYSQIQDKVYASIKPEKTVEIIPKLYEQNIGFSSLPRNEQITLTYSKADEGKVNLILAPYKEKTPTQPFGSNNQITDSTSKTVSADYATQAANFLDSRNVQYSAKLAGDNTYSFIVNKADLWKLNAAVDVAKIGGVANLPDRGNVRDFQAKAGQQIDEQIRNRTANERS